MNAPPRELVERWRTRAPRYTSYPTAPQFRPIPPEAVDRAAKGEGPLSVYVHLPFCASLCHYCGCHVEISHTKRLGTEYVDSVLAEAALWRARTGERPLGQLALGGGTPTWLLPEDMARLVEGIFALWPPLADADLAIEIDPRTIFEAYLDRLVELGFKRFSFGVQDFDPVVLKAVNREQPVELTDRAVAVLRRHGDFDLNFDLVYGLAEQTVERFEYTLREVIRLRPTRVALFHYAHVPWLKPAQKLLERYRMPTTEEKSDMMATAHRMLGEAGYKPVGLDHFALPGDQLLAAQEAGTLQRNFEGYTTHAGLDQIGLGVSAIGAFGGIYAQNTKDRAEHAARVAKGELPIERGLVLTDDDLARRRIIMELFCNLHVELRPGEAERYAREIARLQPLEADGICVVRDDRIEVTELGRHFIRNVCAVFDAYLEGDAERRYSATA